MEEVHILGPTLLASPRSPQLDRRDAPDEESLCEPARLHGCVTISVVQNRLSAMSFSKDNFHIIDHIEYILTGSVARLGQVVCLSFLRGDLHEEIDDGQGTRPFDIFSRIHL